MLKRIWRGFLWDKVLTNIRNGNFSISLEKLARMNAIEPLRPYEKAVRANVFLMDGQHEKARNELKGLIIDLKHSESPNIRYVRLYCESALSSIDGDLDNKRLSKAAAVELNCSPELRRWLPL